MACDHRAVAILRKAELSPPELIPELIKLPILDYQPFPPNDSDEARSLLVQQRIGEPGHLQPELPSHYVFKMKRRKDAKSNKDNSAFTKHEVAKAFDSLLSSVPLALPSIAQALLSHASFIPLDELWRHLHDPKLEKTMASSLRRPWKRMTSRFRRAKPSLVPEIPWPWLDVVASQGNVDYIRLMCQAGSGQEVLNRAFSVALSNHSIEAMGVLLSFGAVASGCQDYIRERFQKDDFALVRLLLSSPKAMDVGAWRYCIEPELESLRAGGKQSPTILPLCLAHRPDVACGPLLLKVMKSQNLQATAVILAYAHLDEDFRDVRFQACELACAVEDHDRRHVFFTMLAESGLVADAPILREELMKDVRFRQLPLIKLLADAAVILDIEPHNALKWAVLQMDFDILESLRNGTLSSPFSPVLDSVPDSTSEEDMLRLLSIFVSRGLASTQLDTLLVRAARKQQARLADTLVRHGASVEFEQAHAIKIALAKANLNILSTLLRSRCLPEILSATIPTAMVIQPRPSRFQAIKALVETGVQNQMLGLPLQRLVSENGDIDSELVQLLLRYNAPIDGVGNDAHNAVLVTARRGNLSVLRMLCDAKPSNDSLSKAVPVAFDARHTCGYDVALLMIKLLLEKGAAGVPVHGTLLTASKQDVFRLDFVRLLTEQGADANDQNGASFAVAIETANFKLLQILCRGCPPSRATLESVFFTALDPRHYNLKALEMLLGTTSGVGAALNAMWDFQKLKGNPNITTIIHCLLRHGLDVDVGTGKILLFAIQEKPDVSLLGTILSFGPSIATLKSAFQAAIYVQPRNVELEVMKLLLEKADSAEIGQTESLYLETLAALAGDSTGIELMLSHKAVVDLESVEAAAAAGSLKVLDLLLSSGVDHVTIHVACLAAASSVMSRDEKQSVFTSLLAASDGMSAENMSALLADSVANLPEHTQLPQLLLELHAEVELETLKISLRTSSHDLFVTLLNSVQDANTLVAMFRYARETTMDPKRRYLIYQYLLGRDIMNMPTDDVSEALLDSLKVDELGHLTFPKLLLEHGAAVGYKNGAPFSLAFGRNNLKAVKLLSQYLDDNVAGIVFDLARYAPLSDPLVRLGVYRCLLRWNISQSSAYGALVEILKDGHFEVSIVKLLLEKGADPSKDEAHCLLLACKAGAVPAFRVLGKYVKLGVALAALLNYFQQESEVISWFNICLAEQPHWAEIDQHELLFQCMRKFPRGTMLLELLFDMGVSASAKTTHCICADWASEPCTALIWALFSTPRIENNAILVLINRGGMEALPAYSTPVRKISAAFGCLLDKTRAPILEALLDMDHDRVLDYKVAGSTLAYMGVYPNILKTESSLLSEAELPLLDASLYLGNFEAFRLINGGGTRNDGSLHTAALMALPKFVNWLLDTHDPNHRADFMGNRIPLALVCESPRQPWCKIANEEADWRTRQNETMKLLAPRTDSTWRYRNKTVLHIALDNGLETTRSMVRALDIIHDPKRDDKYLYKDKDGIELSPDQYVLEYLDDEREQKELRNCLFKEAGLKSRRFKRILPSEGSQPSGYCGLPPGLATAWKAYNDPEPSLS